MSVPTAVDLHTPPQITSELVLELIATVCADLARLSERAPSELAKAELGRAYNTVRDLRLAFDPHDPAAVEAVLRRVTRYADALSAGLPLDLH